MHLLKSEAPKRTDKRNLETLRKEGGTLFCLEAEVSQFKRLKDFKSGAKSIDCSFVLCIPVSLCKWKQCTNNLPHIRS